MEMSSVKSNSVHKAYELSLRNKKISVMDNTPLASAMEDVYGHIPWKVKELEEVDNFIQTVFSFDSVKEDIDGFSIGPAKAIDSAINSFREYVIPTIEEYTERLKKNMDAIPEVDPTAEYKVQLISAPAPFVAFPEEFNLTTFDGKQFPANSKGSRVGLVPGITMDNLAEKMATGNPEIDDAIVNWVASADATRLQEMYDVAFANGTTVEKIVQITRKYTPATNMDAGALLYLVGTRYKDEPSPEVVGLSLAEYTNTMETLVSLGGVLLSRGIRDYQRLIRSDVLIMRRQGKEVDVLASNHDEYVNKGGTVESLLGNLLKSSNKDNTLSTCVDSIFDDTRRWSSFSKISNRTIEKERTTYLKQVAISTLIDISKEQTDLEKEYSENQEMLTVISERGKEVINGLTKEELMDINTVSLKVISRSRFFFTSAETFLSTMQEHKNNNPDMTMEEVKLLASAKMVADFLTLQMTVSKAY